MKTDILAPKQMRYIKNRRRERIAAALQELKKGSVSGRQEMSERQASVSGRREMSEKQTSVSGRREMNEGQASSNDGRLRATGVEMCQ